MSLHHPFIYAYLLAVAVCLAPGAVVLAVALLMSAWPRGRQTARRLAGGVIGSLPFLFFFQGLSLPVLIAIAAIPFLLDIGIWSSPANTLNVIASLGELGLMLAVFVAASVTGLIAGWGVGARVASGVSLRDALRASRAVKWLVASLNKLPVISNRVTPERGIAIGLGIIVLSAGGGLALSHTAYVELFGSDEMDYRGEKIQLARKYVDYDDYKNDPNKLAASEISRVERMMTEARIGPNFADWKDFIDQAFTIKFPGYGIGAGPKVDAAARQFVVEVIEIPKVLKDGYKERYFVLEKMADGTLRLVDDFVTHAPWSTRWSMSIRLVDDRLVYFDRQSKVVRETLIAP